MAAAEGSGGDVATEALTEVTVSKCLSVKLPEVAALAQVWQVTPFFSLCEGHCSLSLLSETPSSRSRTLEGLFELTRCPSRALDSPRPLLPELQRYKDTV